MFMACRPFTVISLAGLVVAGGGCAAADSNFSQYPGFAEYFAEHPPADAADHDEQALLRRHAPRFHLPAGHEGPIDFYRDYIAHGYLVTGDGVRIDGPTPEELNRHRDDPAAQFVHVPGGEAPRSVVYAGVERTDLWTSLAPMSSRSCPAPMRSTPSTATSASAASCRACDGPPGARYNTLPRLKPLPAQILGGYWREGNEGDWQRYLRSRERSADPAEFSRAQAPVFHRNLACVRRGVAGCSLE